MIDPVIDPVIRPRVRSLILATTCLVAACTETHVADDAPAAPLDAFSADAARVADDAPAPDAFELDAVAVDASEPPDVGPDAAIVSCGAGERMCGDRCVDLLTDELACTPSDDCALALECAPRERCIGGGCSCAAPELSCGGRCTSTESDPAHCGRCGNACIAGHECVDGV